MIKMIAEICLNRKPSEIFTKQFFPKIEALAARSGTGELKFFTNHLKYSV